MRKRILFFGIFTFFLSICFCFLWNWADTEPEVTPSGQQTAKKTANPVGGAKEDSKKYYICIEDGNICAYMINGEEKTLVKKTSLNHVLLPGGELKMLDEGIYVSSYEEMCLCFESYTS